MAPEQARGERDLGPSVDIFALGCVLFECLTGQPAFVGEHLMVVLAKVLFQDVPPVETLRPNVPPSLSRLLARMLDKEPARRPPHAAALREEVAALELSLDEPESPTKPAAPAAAAVLSGDAMRLLCVVLAMSGAEPPSREAQTLAVAEPQPRPRRDVIRIRLARLGGRAEWLADGSLAVIVPPTTSAIDQAAIAASCALAIREQWPEAFVTMTTGRGLVEAQLPFGEAIDRALSLLRLRIGAETTLSTGALLMTQAGVWLDELSSKLLEPRFVITTVSGQAVLSGERASVDESRPLLGRPTPCVGREQELSMLIAALDGCVENSAPSGALVIAPPGMGKSRLKHELLRRLRARSLDLKVLSGSGAPMSAGSPYGLLSEALRRLFQMQLGDPPELHNEKVQRYVSRLVPPEDASRVGEFIAALCGLSIAEPSVLMRAAHSDPKIMSEQIQRAFLDLMSAECAAHPCVLVFEDLHWGDAATVKLVDAALLRLRERPLFVLAFARPEVADLFPRLWEQRPIQRIRLGGLSKKAAEWLITSVLGAEVPDTTVARIVEQAAGNALFLEELIRAAAEGKLDEQPETVLAMLQARLSCLKSQGRRVLCAASVFGQTFWRGGVCSLLGPESDAQQTRTCLDDLVDAEIIEEQQTSRFPEETEYRFRHVLVHDAAYSLLPDDDRMLGHRLAGLYLEQAGESDPIVLAEHAHRGRDLERAALHYLHAAEQSYRRDDYDGTLARADRGIECGARGEVLGMLLGLKVEPCLWREDWQIGLQIGKEALALLPRGSVFWNKAVGALAWTVANLGLIDEVNTLVDILCSTDPKSDAVAAYCTALASMASGMIPTMAARELAQRLLARMDQFATRVPESELLAHGHMHRAQCIFGHFLGADPWLTCELARLSEAMFAKACAWRYQGLGQVLTAVTLAALGERTEAERILRGYLESALRANDPFSLSLARLYLALFLAERCAPDQREEITDLARQLIDLGAMESTVGVAHGALARVLMAEGRLDEALEEAEKALSTWQHYRCWRPQAYRTLIEIFLCQGRADAARQAAEEGLRCLESIGGCSGYSEVPLRLAIAEARALAGDKDAARQAIAETIRVIDLRASKIPDPAARTRYVDEVPEHVRARELDRAWLVDI